MSENDVLIEMRRLRAELGDVREELRRSSSFAPRPFTAGRLRTQAGVTMMIALSLAVLLVGWMLYRLLAQSVAGLLDDLLPHPMQVTVNALIEVVALFV